MVISSYPMWHINFPADLRSNAHREAPSSRRLSHFLSSAWYTVCFAPNRPPGRQRQPFFFGEDCYETNSRTRTTRHDPHLDAASGFTLPRSTGGCTPGGTATAGGFYTQ